MPFSFPNRLVKFSCLKYLRTSHHPWEETSTPVSFTKTSAGMITAKTPQESWRARLQVMSNFSTAWVRRAWEHRLKAPLLRLLAQSWRLFSLGLLRSAHSVFCPSSSSAVSSSRKLIRRIWWIWLPQKVLKIWNYQMMSRWANFSAQMLSQTTKLWRPLVTIRFLLNSSKLSTTEQLKPKTRKQSGTLSHFLSRLQSTMVVLLSFT